MLYLCRINQFRICNFRCPVTNAIHPLHPFHLFVCLKTFGHAFIFSQPTTRDSQSKRLWTSHNRCQAHPAAGCDRDRCTADRQQ